jgi:hypothetical protein
MKLSATRLVHGKKRLMRDGRRAHYRRAGRKACKNNNRGVYSYWVGNYPIRPGFDLNNITKGSLMAVFDSLG